MATGRSDYPNQVNNVLGFPFIFRGALDVRATAINDEMKLAATRALAELAREDVPEQRAAGVRRGPHPVRPRVHHPQAVRPARAVLGGARRGAGGHGDRRGAASPCDLRHTATPSSGMHRAVARGDAAVTHKAQSSSRARIVFPEGERRDDHPRGCERSLDERIARPILLGRREVVAERTAELGFALHDYDIVDIERSAERAHYARPALPAAVAERHDACSCAATACSTRPSSR